MANWNTEKIVKLLKDVAPLQIVKGQTGSVASDKIRLDCGNKEYISVTGFSDDCDKIPSNCEIEYIQVEDGLDSDGGLNSDKDATALIYVRVLRILKKAKFLTVKRHNY